MASERTKILEWFHRKSFSKGEFNFEECLVEAVICALNKAPYDARQYVDANLIRLWNYITGENLKHIDNGICPIFSITSSTKKEGIFPPKLKYREKRNRHISRHLNSRPILLRRIDTFNPREYEALGCLSSVIVGADRYRLTPPGNEGGVDFFSRIRQPSSNHIFSGNYSPIRIIGQSKKYSGKVSIGKIREFKTTIDQIKHRYGVGGSLVPDWFSSIQGPVIGWMIAHSGFQSGVVDFAKDEGIILSTSFDIAEILSLSKNFLSESSPMDRSRHLNDEVTRILNI